MTGPFPTVVQTKFSAPVIEADLSPDGTLVAVALRDRSRSPGAVKVLRANDLSVVSEWGGASLARGVCFTHGGAELRYLAESESNELAIDLHRVDLGTGEDTVVTPYSRRHDNPTRVIVSPDHALLAVLGRMAEVWDLESGTVVRRVSMHEAANPNQRMRAAFAPQGPTLYAHGVREDVVRVDLREPDSVSGGWASPTTGPGPVVVSPDGAKLAACGERGCGVFLYDLESGERLGEDEWDEDATYSWEVAFTQDSESFVYALGSPSLVALSDFDEEDGPEVFETIVRVLRKAPAADVFLFATEYGHLVVATKA